MQRCKITIAVSDECSPRQGRSKPTAYTCNRGAKSICSKAVHVAFAVFGALALAFSITSISHAQGADPESARASDAERAGYTDALAYCRGDVSHPEALRADGRVLCFDGLISASNEIWLANNLEHGGVFVVRSAGGDADGAIALANLLLLKEAKIVINDYCLATCADYLFIATAKTFVPGKALVAWTVRAGGDGYCIGFSETSDPRAPRLKESPCSGTGAYADTRTYERIRKFYGGRVKTGPDQPPESVFVRKILKRKFDETGKYPIGLYWTWNPRYYAGAIRTQVDYEAYPQSQEEVDTIVTRLGLPFSVIWDP